MRYLNLPRVSVRICGSASRADTRGHAADKGLGGVDEQQQQGNAADRVGGKHRAQIAGVGRIGQREEA